MGSFLGDEYFVIEDGLNGRTVLDFSPVNIKANGIEWIKSEICNYLPLDITLICLGLNDIFIGDNTTLDSISYGIEQIVDVLRKSHMDAGFLPPEIIIMSPPQFNTDIEEIQFFELEVNKLKGLPEKYRQLSKQKNTQFFDTSVYVTGSSLDGSHLEAESHIHLGKKIAEFILNGFN